MTRRQSGGIRGLTRIVGAFRAAAHRSNLTTLLSMLMVSGQHHQNSTTPASAR